MAAPFAPHQPEQVLCLRLAWHGGARQRGQAQEPRLPRQVRTARAAPGTGPESRLLRPGLVLASSVGRSRIGAEGPAGGVWGARLVLRPGEELASLCLHSPASPAQAVAPFEKMVTAPPKPRDPGRVLALPICRVDVTAAPNKPLQRRRLSGAARAARRALARPPTTATRPSGPRTAADPATRPSGLGADVWNAEAVRSRSPGPLLLLHGALHIRNYMFTCVALLFRVFPPPGWEP